MNRLPDYKVIQTGRDSFAVSRAYWWIGLYWRHLKTFCSYVQAKDYIMWEKILTGKLTLSPAQLAKVLKNVQGS